MMELKTTPRDFGIRHTWFEILPPPLVLTGCSSLGKLQVVPCKMKECERLTLH